MVTRRASESRKPARDVTVPWTRTVSPERRSAAAMVMSGAPEGPGVRVGFGDGVGRGVAVGFGVFVARGVAVGPGDGDPCGDRLGPGVAVGAGVSVGAGETSVTSSVARGQRRYPSLRPFAD